MGLYIKKKDQGPLLYIELLGSFCCNLQQLWVVQNLATCNTSPIQGSIIGAWFNRRKDAVMRCPSSPSTIADLGKRSEYCGFASSDLLCSDRVPERQ